MAGPVLEARNLTKHFAVKRGLFSRQVGAVRAVDDISFTIDPGKTLGLVGESGCGKTTTAKMVLLLEQPTGGIMRFEGQPPDPSAPPPGCAFHPRCPKVLERCRSEAPPEFRVTDSQTSRCWLSAPVATPVPR